MSQEPFPGFIPPGAFGGENPLFDPRGPVGKLPDITSEGMVPIGQQAMAENPMYQAYLVSEAQNFAIPFYSQPQPPPGYMEQMAEMNALQQQFAASQQKAGAPNIANQSATQQKAITQHPVVEYYTGYYDTRTQESPVESREAEIRRQELAKTMETVVAFVLGIAGIAIILCINYFLITAEGNQIVGSVFGPTSRYDSMVAAEAIEVTVFVLVYIAALNEFSSWLSFFLAGLSTEGVIWLIMMLPSTTPSVPSALDWQVLSYAFYATLAIGFAYALVALSLRVRKR